MRWAPRAAGACPSWSTRATGPSTSTWYVRPCVLLHAGGRVYACARACVCVSWGMGIIRHQSSTSAYPYDSGHASSLVLQQAGEQRGPGLGPGVPESEECDIQGRTARPQPRAQGYVAYGYLGSMVYCLEDIDAAATLSASSHCLHGDLSIGLPFQVLDPHRPQEPASWQAPHVPLVVWRPASS